MSVHLSRLFCGWGSSSQPATKKNIPEEASNGPAPSSWRIILMIKSVKNGICLGISKIAHFLYIDTALRKLENGYESLKYAALSSFEGKEKQFNLPKPVPYNIESVRLSEKLKDFHGRHLKQKTRGEKQPRIGLNAVAFASGSGSDSDEEKVHIDPSKIISEDKIKNFLTVLKPINEQFAEHKKAKKIAEQKKAEIRKTINPKNIKEKTKEIAKIDERIEEAYKVIKEKEDFIIKEFARSLFNKMQWDLKGDYILECLGDDNGSHITRQNLNRIIDHIKHTKNYECNKAKLSFKWYIIECWFTIRKNQIMIMKNENNTKINDETRQKFKKEFEDEIKPYQEYIKYAQDDIIEAYEEIRVLHKKNYKELASKQAMPNANNNKSLADPTLPPVSEEEKFGTTVFV